MGQWIAKFDTFVRNGDVLVATDKGAKVALFYSAKGGSNDPETMRRAQAFINAASEGGRRSDRLSPIEAELYAACKWAESALAPFSREPAEKSGIAMLRAAIAKARDLHRDQVSGDVADLIARTLWADGQRRLGHTENDLPASRHDFRERAISLLDHPALVSTRLTEAA